MSASRSVCLTLALILSAASAAANDAPELGRVEWLRDLPAGLTRASQTGLPLFVLFQEVPGCQTCVNFGRGPLSEPLVVDAIESEFVPVAIFNNTPGADAAALQRYGEPAWNNPVVRFFAPGGEELIDRRDGIWSTTEVVERMIDALERAKRSVPLYLQLAAQESRKQKAQTAFAMHCFWQGEATLGGADGVVATRAGWLDGREVVEVTYETETMDLRALIDVAKASGCADRVYAYDDAQLRTARAEVGERAVHANEPARPATLDDQKWHLRQSPLRYVPLSPAQASRVNAAVASGGDALRWLSPRQVRWAARIQQALRNDPARLCALDTSQSTSDPVAYERQLATLLGVGTP